MLDADEQLAVIRGLREGSRDAWARLYDAYSVDVWRYVAKLLGADAVAVGDVVQEAFIDAARSARQFDVTRGTLWSWLTGIAHHRVLAHWRQTNRQNRLRQLVETGNADVRQMFDGQAEAKTVHQQRETADFVRSVLAELPDDYAALLAGKYLDNASLAELSQQWGSSVEAIKSKLARARQEFRAKCEFAAKADA